MMLWSVKTNAGVILKIFFEMIYKCISSINLCIGKDGVKVCTMDSRGHILVDK